MEDGDLKHLVDFRQVYASILQQWLQAAPVAVLGEDFTTLPIIDVATSVQDRQRIPDDFYLSQNYPNPFNPDTTIEYGIPRGDHVKITIMNSLGQQVAVLVNERKSAGRHQMTWHANGHASGTYFLQLISGSFKQTRRMSLVK